MVVGGGSTFLRAAPSSQRAKDAGNIMSLSSRLLMAEISASHTSQDFWNDTTIYKLLDIKTSCLWMKASQPFDRLVGNLVLMLTSVRASPSTALQE